MRVWACSLVAALFLSGAALASPMITPPQAGTGEVILKLGPHVGYEARVGFPEVKDWRSLHIALNRNGCFGDCPIYAVEIAGDGTIHYNGRACVKVAGERTGRLPPDAVRELLDKFRRADFFSLYSIYNEGLLDAPSEQLTLAYDGYVKQVLDIGSQGKNMPPAAAALYDEIDRLTRSMRWVEPNPGHCVLP